jgi:hypothetical protein
MALGGCKKSFFFCKKISVCLFLLHDFEFGFKLRCHASCISRFWQICLLLLWPAILE